MAAASATRGVQRVELAHEGRDEPGGRAVVDLEGLAELLDIAGVHHHDPVGDGQRLFLVVRHENRGDAEFALDLADLLAQADADLGVERRERLVEQQHRGAGREGAGEGDALLLAAREFEREALVEAGEAHQLQHLLDPRLALRLVHAGDLQAEADIVGDVHVRKQRIGLEHHADLALVGRRGR